MNVRAGHINSIWKWATRNKCDIKDINKFLSRWRSCDVARRSHSRRHFLLRLALGVLFLAHGLFKLLVIKPAGIATYFRLLGLPGFFGYLTMAAELGGGTLLILGVATSLVALALVPLILGHDLHGARLQGLALYQ